MSASAAHLPAPRVAIIGGGPAGLMAAEVLAQGGAQVDLFDAMPSVGRKFLLAGRGGLNLTHAEPYEQFVQRYAERAELVRPWLDAFGPEALREWVHALGISTFVGTSGRVFPTDMKAAPLLRAWLQRLRALGVRVHTRHRWQGWQPDHSLVFESPQGRQVHQAEVTVLALGGASWARLGSDGAWWPWLQALGVGLAPLKPANCGFDVAGGWSAFLRERFAGQPVKPVVASISLPHGAALRQQGEFVLTDTGVEGSLIYALSARLRDAIERDGRVTLTLDLLPNHRPEQVLELVRRPRGPRSWTTHLKSVLGLSPLKLALLHEVLGSQGVDDPLKLALALKALPLTLVAPRPVDEAISTAGGVLLEAMTPEGMLKALPGVFCTGEMLDWEAPTGGYLLTATMAHGRWVGQGVLDWWAQSRATSTAQS